MRISVVTIILLCAGCAGLGHNYMSPQGPRYAGAAAQPQPRDQREDTLRIVSFNVAFGRQIDSAISVLRAESSLRNADIILLQEMDAPSTERIAHIFKLHWVYYPATRRDNTGRDFGNAVLSRWPIISDEKLVLPHLAQFGRTLRTATVAAVVIGNDTIRTYSVHLATIVNNTPAQRRDQLRAILADAESYPRVIIGGDFNDPELGWLARNEGYAWPTKHGPRTATVGRLDHIFTKGLVIPDSAAAGTVLNNRNASDHRPIWVRAILK